MNSLYERSFEDQTAELDDMFISILDSRNIKKMDKRRYIQMNADFIYLLALFERFIGHFNIYAIRKRKAVRQNYLSLFTSVCDEKIKTLKKADSWRIYYNKPKKMIDEYSILEREKSGFVIMRELLRDQIDFNEEALSRSLKIYQEARARRNLLAHRGRKPDKIYSDDIKKARISDKLHKSILSYGLYTYSTRAGDKEEDETTGRPRSKKNPRNNPIDLSITPSFLIKTCLNLIYIKESFLMDFKDKGLSTNLHAYIEDGVKKKKADLLILCYTIFKRKIRLHSQITKLRIDEKVNYVLLGEYLFQRKLLKKDNTHKNNTDKIIDSIQEKDHELAKYIKPLLRNYVDRNKEEFFEYTKKILNHSNLAIVQIRDWLLFKRYMRYKEFKDLFANKMENSLKEWRKEKESEKNK
tara:strand:- start:100 stop:1332 length:1233 start_codon:yes stop_codon:yes gene_type:complete